MGEHWISILNIMNIEWKDINDNYKISSEGRIVSRITKKDIKPWKSNKGYLKVNLGRKYRNYLHRMVAETFIPNEYNKPTVNHKNHDKTDNRVENLEWATYKEQTEHDLTMEKRLIKRDEKGRFCQ